MATKKIRTFVFFNFCWHEHSTVAGAETVKWWKVVQELYSEIMLITDCTMSVMWRQISRTSDTGTTSTKPLTFFLEKLEESPSTASNYELRKTSKPRYPAELRRNHVENHTEKPRWRKLWNNIDTVCKQRKIHIQITNSITASVNNTDFLNIPTRYQFYTLLISPSVLKYMFPSTRSHVNSNQSINQ